MTTLYTKLNELSRQLSEAMQEHADEIAATKYMRNDPRWEQELPFSLAGDFIGAQLAVERLIITYETFNNMELTPHNWPKLDMNQPYVEKR
jgi:hypothetical protein